MSLYSPSPSPNPSNPNRIFWSHDETLTLIQTYKHKWISLNRGNLRAADWDSVASAVSARASNTKTISQCRHKIEKLRRKFKSERQQQPYNTSRWIYFKAMDRLENPNSNSDDDDDDDTGVDVLNGNYDQELKIPTAVPIYSVGNSNSNPNYGYQKIEDDDEEEENDDVDDGEEDEEIELRKKVKDNIPMGVPIIANSNSQYRVEEDGEIELKKKVKNNVSMGMPVASVGNHNSRYRGDKDEWKIPMTDPIFSVGNVNVSGGYENQELNDQEEEVELRKKLRFKISTAAMPSFMNRNPNVRPSQYVPGGRRYHPGSYQEINDGGGGGGGYRGDDVQIRNPGSNAKFIPVAVPITSRGNYNPNQYNGVGINESGDARSKAPNSSMSTVPIRKPSPSFSNNYDVKPQFRTPNSLQSSSHAIPIVDTNSNRNWNPNFGNESAKRKRGQNEGNLMTEVARELRKFGDEYIRMEKMKMEKVREMERERLDMEIKKTKLIVDSQKRIMDCFLNAFENENMEENPTNS